MYKYVYLPRVVWYLRISTSCLPCGLPIIGSRLELIETQPQNRGGTSEKFLSGTSTLMKLHITNLMGKNIFLLLNTS